MNKYTIPDTQVITDLLEWGRNYLVYCRAKGYRIATPSEKKYKDPKKLYVSEGPILIKIEEGGDIHIEDEELLIHRWAAGAEENQRKEEYTKLLSKVQDIHYAKWIADPKNIPYRVPDELLNKYGLL